MVRKPGRVYADTSVFGGVLDQEFAEPSRLFFEQVRGGRFSLFASVLVQDELETAPTEVRAVFTEMLDLATIVDLSPEVLVLRQAYLDARIVAPRSANDALHVAMATVSGCGMIVSWNFRHIVHFQKIPLYNAVSALHGYDALAICSPPEVIHYEDEGEDV